MTIGYEFLRWTEKVIKFSDAIMVAFFGQNAILLSQGCSIRVGDKLKLSS